MMPSDGHALRPTPAQQQIERVLAVLPRIEKRSAALAEGRPTLMEVAEREAVNPAATAPESAIPDERAGRARREVAGTVTSMTSAGLVRLAKFSTPTQVRATAFYWDNRRPVVARVTIARLPRQPLRRAALSARAAMGAPDLLRAPELLDHVRTMRVSYVVEELVFGAHPRSPSDKQQVGAQVIDKLFETLERTELRYVREKTHPATRDRLGRLFRKVGAVDGGPREADLLAATARLVDAKHPLPTGCTHGDLVFSNLIRGHTGTVHLIDWESAGIRPVVADMAKMAAAMPGTGGLEHVLDRGRVSPLEASRSGLNVAEQLTRYYLQEVSWWEPKYRRAQHADRMATFESWVNRRMELLAWLLTD